MRQRLVFVSLLLMATFFGVAPGATASNTWYANGMSGNDKNNCKSPQTACKTIRHAISLASSGDSIIIAAGTYKENLTLGSTLNIKGSSASNTIIDGGAAGTVVTVSNANAKVRLINLTIQNGFANSGGGISNVGSLTISNCVVSRNVAQGIIVGGAGGGIDNLGTLTINSSTITGNKSEGGDIHTGRGGGIMNWDQGKLTISRSTLSSNESISPGGSGGGIYNYGSVLIVNSTISGNGAGGQDGGGIFNNPAGNLMISSSTLTNNSAGSGGGISGAATVQNTIVAKNSAGNCDATLTSKGYNLSSDDTCNFSGPGDMNNTDPLLGPLQNNGGPTQTIAELEGSLTIDAGNPNGCTDGQGHLLKTDQRGFPRPGKDKHDHRCDMGAYESQTD